jgi:hypothetical protein
VNCDASLLAKFRTCRLGKHTLDDVLTNIVRQCVEKGLIKGGGSSVDTTRLRANCVKKTPGRLMKHLAKRIFKGMEGGAA